MAKRKNKEIFAETPNAKKTKVVLEDASSSDLLSKVSTAKTFNRPLMKSASKTYEVSLNSIGQSILFLFSFRERLVEINVIDELRLMSSENINSGSMHVCGICSVIT